MEKRAREITPPIAALLAPLTRAYVHAQWIKREWVSLIESMLDDRVRWLVTASKLIRSGVEESSPTWEERG